MWIREQNKALAGDVAQRVDIATRQSETANFTVKFYDPTSTPGDYDLTGVQLEMTIRAKSTVVASLSVAGGVSGEVQFDFTTLQMNFNPGSYSYTITATEGTTYVKTWLHGSVSHIAPFGVSTYPADLKSQVIRIIRIKEKDIQATFLNS